MNILLFLLIFSFAVAEDDCGPIDISAFKNITDISIPNCLTRSTLDEELFTQETNESGPICGDCREQLSARVPASADERKSIKRKAYVNGMANEYKKAMAGLLVDMVSLRKLYSTGSEYRNSTQKCSTSFLQNKINSKCNSTEKSLISESRIDESIANELASLLGTTNRTPPFLIDRSESTNSCGISDQEILSLKPAILKDFITPEYVQYVSNLSVQSTEALWDKISTDVSDQFKTITDIVKVHPILKSLASDPRQFIDFFKSISSIQDRRVLSEQIDSKIFTSSFGNQFDSLTANRCETAATAFVDKVCSSGFRNGDIDLGPFSTFEKVRNGDKLSEAETISDENLLIQNLSSFEFCSPTPQAELSLPNDTRAITPWLISKDQGLSLSEYGRGLYVTSFNTPRSNVCKQNSACNDSEPDCKLFKLWERSKREDTPEYRLANSPDPSINSLLRSIVSQNIKLPQDTRTTLVREGILPQANGQFVERPNPPERQPDYLANVASGAIIPNTGTSPNPQSAGAAPRRPAPGPSQGGQQQAVFQPQGQAAGAIAPSESGDLAEDINNSLRDFQRNLDERLARAQTETPRPSGAPQPQAGRRTATRTPPDRAPVAPTASLPNTTYDSPSADFTSPQPQAPAVADAALDNDPRAAGRQSRDQRNAALSQMSGARANPFASGGGTSRTPAGSGDQAAAGGGSSSVTLNLSGDIPQGLEQVLNGNDQSGANLRQLVQNRSPFRFELNDMIYDVRFNGQSYVVTFVSGNRGQGATLASRVQSIFNNSLARSPAQERNNRLRDLQNTVGSRAPSN